MISDFNACKIQGVMNNRNYKLLVFLQFLLPVYLVVGLFPIPFWYYASIRWVIMTTTIYLSVLSFSNDLLIYGLLMLSIMFLFRPIYPFVIEGIMWPAFILSAIIIFMMTIYYLKENYKRMDESRLPDLTKEINK